MLWQAEEFFDLDIQDLNGEDVGDLDDILFDDREWRVRYLVLKTGGLFSGRRVLISPEAARRPISDEGVLTIELTKAQIDDSPEIDLDTPLTAEELSELHTYYGWGAWSPFIAAAPGAATSDVLAPGGGVGTIGWYAVPVLGAWVPAPGSEEAEEQRIIRERTRDEPALHGMEEVSRYRLRALDKLIGSVGDWLIDDQWVVRYLIADTSRWLPSKDVIVPVGAIQIVDPFNLDVHVDLTSQQIEESPEFEGEGPFDREWEARLFEYYGLRGYWEE